VPAISVIIPCYHSSGTLPLCLDALSRQTFRDFEVILVDSTPDDDAAVQVAAGYTGVACHRHPQRLGAHAARNLGVELATGDLLVFTDPDMAADPRWLEMLAAAHRDGRTVVAGGVDCPPGYWNKAVHFVKYGWWLPGGGVTRRPHLASGNLSLGRSAFDEAGGFPGRFWAGDTELSLRLQAMGHELWLLPGAVTTHVDIATPGKFIRERFDRGYDFGKARVARLNWSRGTCALRLLVTPAVPLMMLVRSGRYAADSRRLTGWLAATPVVLAGIWSWALGEACAHWGGVWRR